MTLSPKLARSAQEESKPIAPQNSIPSKLEKIVQYNVILISCRYIRYYIMTKPEMARTDSDIIEEYNNDIIIEDMFYPIEARVNPRMM